MFWSMRFWQCVIVIAVENLCWRRYRFWFRFGPGGASSLFWNVLAKVFERMFM